MQLTAARLLAGKVAVVTGGGRGIGRSHALELARHGANVVVLDSGAALDGGAGVDAGADPATDVVREIRSGGGRAIAVRGSVTSWDDCADTVQHALALGGLDILVNNAGIVRNRPITEMTESDFDEVVAVHLKGTFAMTKHACDHWRSQAEAGAGTGGRIVNTVSGVGFFGSGGHSAYAAAKAAIASLTTVTAIEMAPYGVTVNAISPVALTRMTESILADPGSRAHGAPSPLDPGNSSPVVAYLASDAAGWITGQILRIEGNTLKRMQGWRVSNQSYTAAYGLLTTAELTVAVPQLWGAAPVGLDTTSGAYRYSMNGNEITADD